MNRSRFLIPWPPALALTALVVALLTTLSIAHRRADVAPASHAAPVGIIDPHTGKQLGFDPKLAHVTSRVLASDDRVQLNAPMPNFHFVDLAGRTHQLHDYKGKVAVFTFVFTECPCTRAYNARIKTIAHRYAAQGVQLVYIFAHPQESMAMVKAFARQQGYTDIPNLTLTRDNGQPLTRLFDVYAATESYLVDRTGVLRYHGRIDDEIFAPQSGKESSLELALQAVLANRPVAHPERPVFACSIPREMGADPMSADSPGQAARQPGGGI